MQQEVLDFSINYSSKGFDKFQQNIKKISQEIVAINKKINISIPNFKIDPTPFERKANEVAKAMMQYFPQSPAKKGALMGLEHSGEQIVNQLLLGMNNAGYRVYKYAQFLASEIIKPFWNVKKMMREVIEFDLDLTRLTQVNYFAHTLDIERKSLLELKRNLQGASLREIKELELLLGKNFNGKFDVEDVIKRLAIAKDKGKLSFNTSDSEIQTISKLIPYDLLNAIQTTSKDTLNLLLKNLRSIQSPYDNETAQRAGNVSTMINMLTFSTASLKDRIILSLTGVFEGVLDKLVQTFTGSDISYQKFMENLTTAILGVYEKIEKFIREKIEAISNFIKNTSFSGIFDKSVSFIDDIVKNAKNGLKTLFYGKEKVEQDDELEKIRENIKKYTVDLANLQNEWISSDRDAYSWKRRKKDLEKKIHDEEIKELRLKDKNIRTEADAEKKLLEIYENRLKQLDKKEFNGGDARYDMKIRTIAQRKRVEKLEASTSASGGGGAGLSGGSFGAGRFRGLINVGDAYNTVPLEIAKRSKTENPIDFFSGIEETQEEVKESGKTFFEKIQDFFYSVIENFQPTLENISSQLQYFFDNYITPFFERIKKQINYFYDNYITPFFGGKAEASTSASGGGGAGLSGGSFGAGRFRGLINVGDAYNTVPLDQDKNVSFLRTIGDRLLENFNSVLNIVKNGIGIIKDFIFNSGLFDFFSKVISDVESLFEKIRESLTEGNINNAIKNILRFSITSINFIISRLQTLVDVIRPELTELLEMLKSGLKTVLLNVGKFAVDIISTLIEPVTSLIMLLTSSLIQGIANGIEQVSMPVLNVLKKVISQAITFLVDAVVHTAIPAIFSTLRGQLRNDLWDAIYYVIDYVKAWGHYFYVQFEIAVQKFILFIYYKIREKVLEFKKKIIEFVNLIIGKFGYTIENISSTIEALSEAKTTTAEPEQPKISPPNGSSSSATLEQVAAPATGGGGWKGQILGLFNEKERGRVNLDGVFRNVRDFFNGLKIENPLKNLLNGKNTEQPANTTAGITPVAIENEDVEKIRKIKEYLAPFDKKISFEKSLKDLREMREILRENASEIDKMGISRERIINEKIKNLLENSKLKKDEIIDVLQDNALYDEEIVNSLDQYYSKAQADALVKFSGKDSLDNLFEKIRGEIENLKNIGIDVSNLSSEFTETISQKIESGLKTNLQNFSIDELREKIQQLQDEFQINIPVNLNLSQIKNYASGFEQIFANLYQTSSENMKEFFYAQKSMSIANAMISTYEAANKALATGVPPLNFVNMAMVIAQGITNVGMIASQMFARGGLVRGGSGTADDVPAMLTGGEYVIQKKAVDLLGIDMLSRLNNVTASDFSDSTPRTGDRVSAPASGGTDVTGTGGSREKQENITIANFVNPNQFSKFLQTQDGKNSIVNVIAENKTKLKSILK